MTELRKISDDELRDILAEHKLWLESDEKEGKQADLSWADLSRANLHRANLHRANLHRANLHRANLSNANLSWANLREANLRRANLREADLSEADLSEADLSEADLREADLREADLREANFSANQIKQARSWQDAIFDDNQRQSLGLPNKAISTPKRIRDAEKAAAKSSELEQEIEQEKNQTKINELTKELEKQKQEAGKLEELQDEILKEAITEISKSTKESDGILQSYKWQSWGLIVFGAGCYIAAICVAYIIFGRGADNTVWENVFRYAPSFVLTLIGTALFRHDWKIRQLSQQLIQQKSKIGTATGILEASLTLSRIGDLKDEKYQTVTDSFEEMRHALLFDNPEKPNHSNHKEDTNSLTDVALKQLLKLNKTNN